jgi:hypothetical protein
VEVGLLTIILLMEKRTERLAANAEKRGQELNAYVNDGSIKI